MKDFLNNKYPETPYKLPITANTERGIQNFLQFLELKIEKNNLSPSIIDAVISWSPSRLRWQKLPCLCMNSPYFKTIL